MMSTIKTADGAAVVTSSGALAQVMLTRRVPGGTDLLVALELEPSEAMLMACELERAAIKANDARAVAA